MSGFGARLHPLLGVWLPHTGIDISAAAGEPVRAIGNGVVVFVQSLATYGLTVAIGHGNGLVSVYAHLRRPVVREGAVVRVGGVIGRVGHSGRIAGTHLHLETLRDGNPVDPLTIVVPPGANPVRSRVPEASLWRRRRAR